MLTPETGRDRATTCEKIHIHIFGVWRFRVVIVVDVSRSGYLAPSQPAKRFRSLSRGHPKRPLRRQGKPPLRDGRLPPMYPVTPSLFSNRRTDPGLRTVAPGAFSRREGADAAGKTVFRLRSGPFPRRSVLFPGRDAFPRGRVGVFPGGDGVSLVGSDASLAGNGRSLAGNITPLAGGGASLAVNSPFPCGNRLLRAPSIINY